MRQMITQAAVLEYIVSELGLEAAAIQPDTPLFTSGLIDSFALAGLLQFMEERAEISIDEDELTVENIDSVGAIVRFVASKTGS